MERKMAIKQKKYNPQEMIQIGMLFFLLGVFVNMIGDERMIGALFADLITNQSLLSTIQGVAAGLSLPFFGVSIYYNIHGLSLLRSLK
jgi:hypothetical protein